MRAARWAMAVTAARNWRRISHAFSFTDTIAFVSFTAKPAARTRPLTNRPATSSLCLSPSFLNSGTRRFLLGNKNIFKNHPQGLARLVAMSTSTSMTGESWCGHELHDTVTTDWVEDHLGDPDVAIVDIRGKVNKHREEGSDYFSTTYEGLKSDYLDLHIPGAVFVDWTEDIAGVDENGVPAQLTDRETFVEEMQERGVGARKRVVVYDNGDMLFATRFCRFGHDRVSVMDGGWAKWMAENRDITPDCPCPLKVYTEWDLPKERERPELVVSASDVRGALDKQHRGSGTDGGRGIQLLDARASVQYTGEVRRARLGGHIPGAVNTPYREFLTEGSGPDGKYNVFKSLEGIQAVFKEADVDTSPSGAPVIAYCNGGVASTVPLFLLFQLQQQQEGPREKGSAIQDDDGQDSAAADSRIDRDGNGNSWQWANYDGSWNEWGNDESAPVER